MSNIFLSFKTGLVKMKPVPVSRPPGRDRPPRTIRQVEKAMASEENKNTDFMSRLLANVDPEARESLVRRSEAAPAAGKKKAASGAEPSPAAGIKTSPSEGDSKTAAVSHEPAKTAGAVSGDEKTDSAASGSKQPSGESSGSKTPSAMPEFLRRKKAAPGRKPVKKKAPVPAEKVEEAEIKEEDQDTSAPEAPAEPVDEGFLEELAADMAADNEDRYQIPVKRGHDKSLRFWFDPMSQKIWDGYADLIYRDELSVDNNAAHQLLLPFILEHYEGKFLYRNELNLLPLDKVEPLAGDLRKAARALKRKDLQNPALALVAANITIDLLVPEEEYNEKYLSGSPLEKRRAVRENLPVAAEFYETVAAYLEEMLRRYKPKGFTSIAISAPV